MQVTYCDRCHQKIHDGKGVKIVNAPVWSNPSSASNELTHKEIDLCAKCQEDMAWLIAGKGIKF